MTVPNPWRLGCCQYPVTPARDFSEYRKKIDGAVREAAAGGARLLVFPEYGALELVAALDGAARGDPAREFDALQDLFSDYMGLFREQARKTLTYIVAPSFPVRKGSGFRNRAYLFGPNGDAGFQDKLMLTREEAEHWNIVTGDQMSVFNTRLGCIAIDLCYDIAFPVIARAQAAAGAELILVPSRTDSEAGYNRVRVGARARALENQCLVALAPTVGAAPWSALIGTNVGGAGVFAPPDRGFPRHGVVVQGKLNEPRWIYAEIDLGRLVALRSDPDVFIRRQWHGLMTGAPRVVAVDL
jgi:predicted amidohydrolase